MAIFITSVVLNLFFRILQFNLLQYRCNFFFQIQQVENSITVCAKYSNLTDKLN